MHHWHIQRVTRIVPPDRLLVFNVKDGWEPLCKHLGVPVPLVPFPHANPWTDTRTAQMTKMQRLLWLKRIVQPCMVALLLLSCFLCVKRTRSRVVTATQKKA